jgi:hypothetical protein
MTGPVVTVTPDTQPQGRGRAAGGAADQRRAVTGDYIRARRHARELVADLHWRGLPVPPLYAHMAAEFQDLVASGEYAAWVASGDSVGRGPGEPGPSGP